MRRPYPRLAAAAALALLCTVPAASEEREAASAQSYKDLATLPDWSGVWAPDWSVSFGPGGRPTPTLLPEAQASYDAYHAAKEDGLNQQLEDANCLPPGMPRIMMVPYPIEFLYSPGRITIITETYSQVRRIYTDGRPLPEDPDPFFNGHSIGHWEDDTLIAETIGFSPLTKIADGVDHSDQMRIRERIFLENPDRIVVEMTITDPQVLAEPFVIRQPFDRKHDWEMREYVCQENNRDASDAQGRATLDLGLDGSDPFGPFEDEAGE